MVMRSPSLVWGSVRSRPEAREPLTSPPASVPLTATLMTPVPAGVMTSRVLVPAMSNVHSLRLVSVGIRTANATQEVYGLAAD